MACINKTKMARVAKAMKKDLVEAKKACVGKKMEGFKFADTKNTKYASCMNEYIGRLGKITEYNEKTDEFKVEFKDDYWFYPAKLGLKHIVEEADVVIEHVTEEEIDDAYVKMLKEEIADLSARLDGAYKEQEEMLEELSSWLKPFPSAFTKLQEHAGVITPEDVTYHTNLILKIMEHKFGYKPKSWE
jgi:hypothetical protein